MGLNRGGCHYNRQRDLVGPDPLRTTSSWEEIFDRGYPNSGGDLGSLGAQYPGAMDSSRSCLSRKVCHLLQKSYCTSHGRRHGREELTHWPPTEVPGQEAGEEIPAPGGISLGLFKANPGHPSLLVWEPHHRDVVGSRQNCLGQTGKLFRCGPELPELLGNYQKSGPDCSRASLGCSACGGPPVNLSHVSRGHGDSQFSNVRGRKSGVLFVGGAACPDGQRNGTKCSTEVGFSHGVIKLACWWSASRSPAV